MNIDLDERFMFTSLTAIDACERQLFDQLLQLLVASPIFVPCQRLIVRKTAELFGLNCVI